MIVANQTNAEAIIGMLQSGNDEALRFIACPDNKPICTEISDCEKCKREWLKQEYVR